MPHRLGRAEFEQRDTVDTLDRARIELRRPADGWPWGGIGSAGEPGGVSTGSGAGVDSAEVTVESGAVSTGTISAGTAGMLPGSGDTIPAGCAAIAATEARVGIATDPPTVPIGAVTVGMFGIVGRSPIAEPLSAAVVRSPRSAIRRRDSKYSWATYRISTTCRFAPDEPSSDFLRACAEVGRSAVEKGFGTSWRNANVRSSIAYAEWRASLIAGGNFGNLRSRSRFASKQASRW
jgi:hypothetical protein